jgi:hypothetical protein
MPVLTRINHYGVLCIKGFALGQLEVRGSMFFDRD